MVNSATSANTRRNNQRWRQQKWEIIYDLCNIRPTRLSYWKLKTLLEKAGFCEEDFLYILGDVIDRNGDGGVGILRWLLSQSNVQLVLGNHEAMLLACAFLFDEITDDSIADFDSEKIEILSNYQLNGGDVTLKSLAKLNKESPETVADILDYLRDCPLYEAVTAGGKDYFLCHSGIDEFEKSKKSATILPTLLFGRGLELTMNILTIL